MSLNQEQQELVEQAARLVPAMVKKFLESMPCLRQVAKGCDLQSAAFLACCRAAKTYDKTRGVSVSAYFSIAAKNGMLREVHKELRTNAHSIMRIPLEQIHERQPPKRTVNPTAMPSMLTLTETERDWVERFVFDGVNRGGSFRAFGRESGRDCRTAKKMLYSILDKLKTAIEDHPDS